MGIVKATETGLAPKGFPESRSIYKNDEVKLYSKPTEKEEVSKLVGCEDDMEEMDVIYLDRTFSTETHILGDIFVPSYLKVHLREPPASLGEHCLADIMTKFAPGNLPLSVTMNNITRGASVTKDDSILMNESNLKIVAEVDYTVAYVTIFDPQSNSRGKQEAREIPDFMKIRVRPIRQQSLPVTGDVLSFRKPSSRLFQLTLSQYSRLYVPESEDEYQDIGLCDQAEEPRLPPRSADHPSRSYCGPPMPHHHKGRFPPQTKNLDSNSTPTSAVGRPPLSLPTPKSKSGHTTPKILGKLPPTPDEVNSNTLPRQQRP